jgi:hypothetical protein
MFWTVLLVRIVGARQALELISSGKANIVKHFKSTIFRKGVVSPKSNYSTLRVLTTAKQEFVNFVVDHDCLNESRT